MSYKAVLLLMFVMACCLFYTTSADVCMGFEDCCKACTMKPVGECSDCIMNEASCVGVEDEFATAACATGVYK